MMRSLKYFFVSCFLTICFGMFFNTAFAVDYYWGAGQYTGPSPDAACRAGMQAIFPSVNYTGYTMDSATQATCRGGPYNASYMSARRGGDSCPPDHTYDAATGECVPPEPPEPEGCAALAGTSQPFSKTGVAPDTYMGRASGGMGIPSQSGCISGCAASTVDQKCTVRVSGTYVCRGTASFTGESCSSSAPLDVSDTADGPEPQTFEDSEPCKYETQPDGTQACSSSWSSEKEGQQCGEVNGVSKCIDAPPKKDAVDIDTTVDTQTNADGSSTTTKTDTATKTTCSGINSCTSTTTTTTTVTNKGSDGTTTSESSTCKGDHCSSSSSGDDQDGDGMDDCQIGGDCSDEFTAPGGGGDDVPGFGESVQGFMDRVSAAPFLSSVSSISVPSGGSCDFPEGQTAIGTISMDSMCDLASTLDGLRLVFLACWALAAVRVFMSA